MLKKDRKYNVAVVAMMSIMLCMMYTDSVTSFSLQGKVGLNTKVVLCSSSDNSSCNSLTTDSDSPYQQLMAMQMPQPVTCSNGGASDGDASAIGCENNVQNVSMALRRYMGTRHNLSPCGKSLHEMGMLII